MKVDQMAKVAEAKKRAMLKVQARKSGQPVGKSSKVVENSSGHGNMTQPLFSKENIEDFIKKGEEYPIRCGNGEEIWLVPAYTESDRREISAYDLAMLDSACRVLDGTYVGRGTAMEAK